MNWTSKPNYYKWSATEDKYAPADLYRSLHEAWECLESNWRLLTSDSQNKSDTKKTRIEDLEQIRSSQAAIEDMLYVLKEIAPSLKETLHRSLVDIYDTKREQSKEKRLKA